MDEQLFNLNMEACKKLRPGLYERLYTSSLSEKYELVISDHDTRINNLVNREAQMLFYEQADPLGSMAEHMTTCINKLQGIMVFLGFGLGYGPLMIEKQSNFTSRSLIIVEPEPEILLLAFHSLNCTSLLASEDVLFLVDTPTEEIGPQVMGHLAHNNRLINAKNIQIIDLPASLVSHSDYYRESISRITSTVGQGVMLVGNCPNDALQGLDTTLANLPLHIRLPGIKGLKDSCKGFPGIVVSSGPSLDKNIGFIKSLERKAVIASADASLTALLKHQTKPHFVTSVERVEATGGLFDGVTKEDIEDVFLVAAPLCHPNTFDKFHGDKISCEREHGFWRLLNLEKGSLPPGPSAGNMSFRLLEYLGCDPIILVGQDLALSEDGRTNYTGSRYGEQQQNYLQNMMEIEGNYTKRLQTNWILKMFHEVYEWDVANTQTRVINCTEGGAKIAGTEVMSLKAAAELYLTSDLALAGFEGSLPSFVRSKLCYPTKTVSDRKFDEVKLNIESAINQLSETDRVIAHAKDAVKKFEKLIADELQESSNSNEESGDTPEALEEAMNAISELTTDEHFRSIAMDILSPVFVHTMMSYVQALANAEDEKIQEQELARNVNNLANNFEILLRYVKALYEGHLERYQSRKADEILTLYRRDEKLKKF